MNNAVNLNHPECLKYAIAMKCGVNYRGNSSGRNDDKTPLATAIDEDRSECAKLLVQAGGHYRTSDPARDLCDQCGYMAQNAETIAIRLLRAGVSPNYQWKRGLSPMFEAIHTGKLTLLGVLVDCKADPNIEDGGNHTALTWACVAGYTPAVRVLCEKLSIADIDSETAVRPRALDRMLQGLNHAAGTNIIKILLEYGANPDSPFGSTRQSPLDGAINRLDLDVVRLLLLYKADVKTKAARSPIYRMADRQYRTIAKVLIEHGARPTAGEITYPTIAMNDTLRKMYSDHLLPGAAKSLGSHLHEVLDRPGGLYPDLVNIIAKYAEPYSVEELLISSEP